MVDVVEQRGSVADLHALGIARMSGLGPTIEDLSLALRVEGGELLFPVSLTVDGIPMTGTLGLDRRELHAGHRGGRQYTPMG